MELISKGNGLRLRLIKIIKTYKIIDLYLEAFHKPLLKLPCTATRVTLGEVRVEWLSYILIFCEIVFWKTLSVTCNTIQQFNSYECFRT